MLGDEARRPLRGAVAGPSSGLHGLAGARRRPLTSRMRGVVGRFRV